MRVRSLLLVLSVIVGLAAVAPTVHAADVHWVNVNENAPAAPGTDCDNAGYTSIEDAVIAAVDGDTIEVCAGTYNLAAAIAITEQLTINGANQGVSPNDPTDPTQPNAGRGPETIVAVTGGTRAFNVGARNVTIDGFAFSDSAVDAAHVQEPIIGAGAGFGGNANFITVRNNLFDSTQRIAVYFNSPPETPTNDGFVDDNRAQDPTRPDTNCGTPPAAAPGGCARQLFNLWETNDLSFQRNVVVATQGNLDRVRTLNFRGSEDVIVADNIVHYACHFTCMTIAGDATDIEMSGNEFMTHHGNAIQFFKGSVPDPVADWFTGNATIHHNTFTIENGDYAVAIDDPFADLDDVHINRNAFSTDSRAIRNGAFPTVPGADTVDAECNWYGAAAGPDTAAAPTGDFFGPADFTPWLTVADLDADCPPAASIDDVKRKEGNRGTRSFVFTVTLSAPAAGGETLDFATNLVTAKANDLIATNGTLMFSTGETQQTITVEVRGDRRNERNEKFTVDLSNPTGELVIADGQGVGTIRDDD